MSPKCQGLCGKETKELFEVTNSEGSKWFCKECASNRDLRVIRKSGQSKTTKTILGKSGRYGGTIG